MVKSGGALGEDTLRVELELGGINGNSDGLVSQSVVQTGAIASLDFRVALDGVLFTLNGSSLASTVSSSVGIVSSLGDLAVNNVSESFGHPTTVATFGVVLGGLSTVN